MQYSSILSGAFVAFVLLLSHVSAKDVVCKAAAGCVGVEIYYETLCPDSMRFINRQLIPSYPNFADHLDITFVPYGKAQQQRDDTGKWTFTCQHGPSECKGNKGQACGLQAIQTAEKPEEQQRISVEFVGCVMSSSRPATSIQQCAETVGLNAKAKELLTACEPSEIGDNLLAAHGDTTHGLQPRVTFIPTIVINNSRQYQEQAFRDFTGLICSLLPGEDKPTVCKQ